MPALLRSDRSERKLALHKRKIENLHTLSQEKGLTLIPLSIYLKKGIAKIKIACCRGKKFHDKRSSLKEKEHKRAIDRAMRDHG